MSKDTGHGYRKCGKSGCGRGGKIHTDCPRGTQKALSNDTLNEMFAVYKEEKQKQQAPAPVKAGNPVIEAKMLQPVVINHKNSDVPFVNSDRFMSKNNYVDKATEVFMEKHKSIFNDIEYGQFGKPKKIRIIGGEELTMYPLSVFGYEVAYFKTPNYYSYHDVIVNKTEEAELKKFLSSGSSKHIKHFKKLDIDSQTSTLVKMLKTGGAFENEKWARLIAESGNEIDILKGSKELDDECKKVFSKSSAFVYLVLADKYGYNRDDSVLEEFRKNFPNDNDVQSITLSNMKDMTQTIIDYMK